MIGAILGALVPIVSITVLIIQNHSNKSDYKAVAEGRFYEYQISPSEIVGTRFADSLYDINHKYAFDPGNERIKNSITSVANEIYNTFQRNYDAMWVFHIYNKGNKRLDNLALVLENFSGYYWLTLYPEKQEWCGHFSNKIELDFLDNFQNFEIKCWRNVSDDAVSVYPFFSHSNGIITIKYPEVASKIYLWIERNFIFLSIVISLSILLNLLIGVSYIYYTFSE